jgi:hypothetical protein
MKNWQQEYLDWLAWHKEDMARFDKELEKKMALLQQKIDAYIEANKGRPTYQWVLGILSITV